jgi:hypothetical protein
MLRRRECVREALTPRRWSKPRVLKEISAEEVGALLRVMMGGRDSSQVVASEREPRDALETLPTSRRPN